jgi:hypothetical protein
MYRDDAVRHLLTEVHVKHAWICMEQIVCEQFSCASHVFIQLSGHQLILMATS